MQHPRLTLLLVGSGLLVWTEARADGVDLAYFTRVGGMTLHGFLMAMGLLMLLNYLLNLIVIGLPALRIGPAGKRTVLLELVWLTFLGQVADRLGAVLTSLVCLLLTYLAPVGRIGDAVVVGLNLLLSGLAVGMLALYFLRRRWGLPLQASRAISLAAAVITNPAWVFVARLVNPKAIISF